MARFWEMLASMFERPVFTPEVRRTACGRSIVPCSACRADVVLSREHWGHPTESEDIRFWSCPVCVNKARMARGLARIEHVRSGSL